MHLTSEFLLVLIFIQHIPKTRLYKNTPLYRFEIYGAVNKTVLIAISSLIFLSLSRGEKTLAQIAGFLQKHVYSVETI